MVHEDVEVHAVGEVIGRSERPEAAPEGVEAVVGEDFDNEPEIAARGFVGDDVEARVRVRGESGAVVVGEEEQRGDGEEEEERDEAPLRTGHC